MDELEYNLEKTSDKHCFKEAVCIDVNRVYDSCCDKDCYEDLQVHFLDCDKSLVNSASSVKVKYVKILYVDVEVDSIPYNKGFYSVDLTYYFLVNMDLCRPDHKKPDNVNGLSFVTKKVILYGSEGNVAIFSSDSGKSCEIDSIKSNNNPKATVQVSDPILLGSKLEELPDYVNSSVSLPAHICSAFCGDFCGANKIQKAVYITLGVFSVVQMERRVQMLIPIYDFCIPEKSCSCSTDDPCELFKKIKFPYNNFFPPKLNDLCKEDDYSCPEC